MLHRENPGSSSPPLAKWIRSLVRVSVGGLLIGISQVLNQKPDALSVMAICSVVLWGLLVLDVFSRRAPQTESRGPESEELISH
jgi:cytochrome c biogenesis protein CcdA